MSLAHDLDDLKDFGLDYPCLGSSGRFEEGADRRGRLEVVPVHQERDVGHVARQI